MERLAQIKKLSEKDKVWDIVVVGGGATGLGVAVDAATRGLSVALLEKTDFAKCTSSRSVPSSCTAASATCRKATSCWCSKRCANAAA